MMKKRVGGQNNYIKYFFCFFILISYSLPGKASRIYDYETDIFILELINEIKAVNNIDKNINFIVVSDDNINAYVDINNTVYITSALIENSDDYVALLAVLAHEIGHIIKNHVNERKKNIKEINKLKNFSYLTIFAGSLISNNSEYMKSLLVNEAGFSQIFLEFTKDQEREADYYSIDTINKIGLPINSIVKLLKKIQKKNNISDQSYITSTHPVFAERIDILEFNKIKNKNEFNSKTNHSFNYIKSKFIGFRNKSTLIGELNEPYKDYANAIKISNNGNLKKSLKILNKLISENKKNYFLVETKADILMNFGYSKEANKFYDIVLKEYPKNKYVRAKIVLNKDIEAVDKSELEKFFNENSDLIYYHLNNKLFIIKYLKMSKVLGRFEWINFLENLIMVKNIEEIKVFINELELDKINDQELENLLKKIKK